jgi:hypothetical protein
MHFTRKDTVATALVAATVVAYIGYLTFGSVPFAEDVRGMAAVGLVLGFASRRVGGRHEFPHERLAFAGGLGSMALGIVALATENELVLAAFMASIVALWAAAVYVHSGHGHPGRVHASH